MPHGSTSAASVSWNVGRERLDPLTVASASILQEGADPRGRTSYNVTENAIRKYETLITDAKRPHRSAAHCCTKHCPGSEQYNARAPRKRRCGLNRTGSCLDS